MIKRKLDYQRRQVYKVEWKLSRGKQFMDELDTLEYVLKVCNTLGRKPPTIKFDGRLKRRAYANVYRNLMVFPRIPHELVSEIAVLHELTHVIEHPRAFHGPDFVTTLLWLIHEFHNERFKEFENQYVIQGVDFHDIQHSERRFGFTRNRG